MKKLLSSIVLLLLHFMSSAQFSVDLKFLPSDLPIANVCIDANITMRAIITSSGSFDVSKTQFTWYFGDGSQQTNLGFDQVTYSYSKNGGYYVLLKVVDEFGTIRFARKKIQVGLKPKFTETTVNTDKPICKSDRVILSAKISSASWEYKFSNQIVFDSPYQVADNYPQYARSITFFSFAENATLNNIADLEKIFIKAEHSASSNLQIKIKCPNNTEVILKNFGGTDSKLGVPILDPIVGIGTAYEYAWTNSPTFGTLNAEATTKTTLPAGNYTSDEALTNLLGCPLNGEWTLSVNDNQSTNNGYLFAWGINLNPSLQEPNWEFSNTFNKNTVSWTGEGIGLPTNLTEGNSFTSTVFATPKEYGATLYTFAVNNDFGCSCDTAINVLVTAPTFSFDPEGGEAPIEITFTNSTDWGKTFEWLFGYENALSIEENPIFTYRAEQDTSYKILLTSFSESGCKDTISQKIFITVPNSDIDLPNVFTPNGDGNNDIWHIKPKAQDKELQDVLAEIDCRIYNRDGRMVCRFKTPEEAQDGWDGTTHNNGNGFVSEGIYFYTIKTKGKDGKELSEEFQRGFIHVFK